MRIHYLQHVPFEDLGCMEANLIAKRHELSSTCLYEKPVFPDVTEIDWLIIMGGPMGVYDEEAYPWLIPEKRFIAQAIDAEKTVLGICLGAQLIAEVLGAKVFKNDHKEIGWFPIKRSEDAGRSKVGTILPSELEVFHWHGDTFEIPHGAILLASSEACRNQGFILDDRVMGLQFHLEVTPESASRLIQNCRHELVPSRYVQKDKQIMADLSRFNKINNVMDDILARLEEA